MKRLRCKREDDGRERSHEALGAIRGRKVCSIETTEGATYTINDREEGARETENSVELMGVHYYDCIPL